MNATGSAPDASVGIGFAARVDGNRNVAVGGNARIGGEFGDFLSVEDSVAVGSFALALGDDSIVIGSKARALAASAVAIGSQAFARGEGSTVVGYASTAYIDGGVAIGRSTFVNGAASGTISISTPPVPATIAGTAVGDRARVGDNSVALGGYAVVGVRNSFTLIHNGTALGAGTLVSAEGGVAVGTRASALAVNSVAIGANAVANRENSVSVGVTGAERQIVNVADATEDTDAVNLRQLALVGNTVATGVAGVLGGGAAWNPLTGTFTAPSYAIQGSNYNNVGAAFAAVDGQLTSLYSAIAGIETTPGPQGPAGPQGPEGPMGPGSPLSAAYDDATRGTLTLEGADGTVIQNVADGVVASDAVNLGQLQAGDAETLASANTHTDTRETAIRTDMATADASTLASAQTYADTGDAETLASARTYSDNTATETLTAANTYTDTRFAQLSGLSDSFETFRNETDRRFQQQDRRIDKLSAMSGAYAGMAMNTAGLAGRNRIGVGVGAQGGEQALAVGYQRVIGNRASVSIAGAFSGNETSVSAGAGFSW